MTIYGVPAVPSSCLSFAARSAAFGSAWGLGDLVARQIYLTDMKFQRGLITNAVANKIFRAFEYTFPRNSFRRRFVVVVLPQNFALAIVLCMLFYNPASTWYVVKPDYMLASLVLAPFLDFIRKEIHRDPNLFIPADVR